MGVSGLPERNSGAAISSTPPSKGVIERAKAGNYEINRYVVPQPE